MNIEKEDIQVIKKDIAECHKLVEDGADWDKKNKLKIFEGVYCMMIRDFKKASDLFVSSIATFTALEVMSFTEFVFYAVVLGLLTQDRKTIKKEIIHSPDILAVNRDIPYLKEFSEIFNNCEYSPFPYWNPVDSIIFQTQQLTIVPELIAKPVLYGPNNQENIGLSGFAHLIKNNMPA
jgi:26S proteasome regulatory subunit N7